METDEYNKLADVEEHMWWFRALHQHLLYAIRRFLKMRSAIVLDAGCGTGGFLRMLHTSIPGLTVLGLDIWFPACEIACVKGHASVINGEIAHLPLVDNSIGCIISADVLYHEGIVPEMALKEVYRCLHSGGIVILNLPAYEWLRSYHDERVKTHKRFRRSEARELLSSVGFDILYSTYWNTLLFPLMVLRRKVLKPAAGNSDVIRYPKVIEGMFHAFMRLEQSFLHRGGQFFFGGSILIVGGKHYNLGTCPEQLNHA